MRAVGVAWWWASAPFVRPIALLALHGLWIQMFLSGFGGKGWRHAVSLALAVGVAVFLSRLRGPAAWGAASVLAAISVVGLVLVLFLPAIRGAQSWIRFGPINLQPSELAKVGLVFANAIFLGARGGRGLGPWRGLAFVGLGTAVVTGLTLIQPDLGTAIVIMAISWIQALASRAHRGITIGVPLALAAALLERIMTPQGRKARPMDTVEASD
ncbi:FtsW/RodA/SpoVE family cell cycle protein [bacterium]|nr:FtsW/RodA/SpoVE family cell cycle protein [bacterium]